MSGLRPGARERLVLQGTRERRTLSSRQIVFRRISIRAAKLSLPVLAVMLLGAVALWPELARIGERGRTSFRRVFAVEAESGSMLRPHYRGVSESGRPYTMTATWANQVSQNKVDLGEPVGDMLLESGNWLHAKSKRGVFLQHSELLDMSGDVEFYRDDGTTMRTQTAAVDIKQGAAASNDRTHAEGPFGILDAQGFAMTDKGATIQFQGPARLILNGADK